MRQLELNSDWMYAVYEASTGKLYVEALAGGHGLYRVRARLDERETAIYRADPAAYVAVVRELLRRPEEFSGRVVSDEEWDALVASGRTVG